MAAADGADGDAATLDVDEEAAGAWAPARWSNMTRMCVARAWTQVHAMPGRLRVSEKPLWRARAGGEREREKRGGGSLSLQSRAPRGCGLALGGLEAGAMDRAAG